MRNNKLFIIIAAVFAILSSTSIVNAVDMPEGFTTYNLSKDEVKELCNIGIDYDALNDFFASKYFEERTLYWVDNEKNEYYYEVKKYDKDGNMYYSDLICSVPGGQVADSIFDSDSFPFTDKAIEEILRINNISGSVNRFYVIESTVKTGYYAQPEYMVYVITDNSEYILCITFDTDNMYFGTLKSCDDLKFGFKAYTKDEFLSEYYGDGYIPTDQERNVNIYIDGTKLDYNKGLKSYGVSFNMPLSDILGYIGAEIERVPASDSVWYREQHDSDMETMRDVAVMEETEFDEAEFNENYRLSDFYRITLDDTVVDVYYDWHGYPLNDNEVLLNSPITNKDNNYVYCSSSSLEKILSRLGYSYEIDINNAAAYISKKISVYVNNNQIDFASEPIMENDRILVPMRRIFEELGAEVTWDNDTNTATAVKDNTEIKIIVDSDIMLKNGVEAIKLDAPARLVDDAYVYVPLRAVSEAFGCTVNWNEELRRADIIMPQLGFEQKVSSTGTKYYTYNGESYWFAKDFSEGMAAVSVSHPYTDKQYWGYINTQGELVIPYQFTEAGEFKNGTATVKSDWYDDEYQIDVTGARTDGKEHIIDTDLNIVPQIYRDDSVDFGAVNFYGAKLGNKVLFEKAYNYIVGFSEGYSLADIGYMQTDSPIFGVINTRGEMILPFKYYTSDFDDAKFKDGIIPISEVGKGEMFFMDINGNNVFGEKTFNFARQFSEGFAAVKINDDYENIPSGYDPEHNKWAYIDKTGEFVSGERYDSAESFKDGYANVMINGKWHKINTKFEIAERGK